MSSSRWAAACCADLTMWMFDCVNPVRADVAMPVAVVAGAIAFMSAFARIASLTRTSTGPAIQ